MYHAGIRWRFTNTEREGWINRGHRRGVLLSKHSVVKLDDSDAILTEFHELARQLEANSDLSDSDRELLSSRLSRLAVKLSGEGTVPAPPGGRRVGRVSRG
jgi:hypothetical protein